MFRRSAPFGARSDPSVGSVPALLRRLAPPPLLLCAEPTTTPDSNQQVDQSGHDTPLKQGQSLVSGICGSVYVGAPACAMCAAGLESTPPGGGGGGRLSSSDPLQSRGLHYQHTVYRMSIWLCTGTSVYPAAPAPFERLALSRGQ